MGKPLSNDIKLRAENFPNPSKVDVSEYKMMDSRWLRGGRGDLKDSSETYCPYFEFQSGFTNETNSINLI
ncbi:17294_t:CDS:2 [Rhizophagus irregularis]|nr:17294_t:CDS:2 [Rhizophagus irregularis]